MSFNYLNISILIAVHIILFIQHWPLFYVFYILPRSRDTFFICRIMFVTLLGVTELSAQCSAQELVIVLNEVFTKFDVIVQVSDLIAVNNVAFMSQFWTFFVAIFRKSSALVCSCKATCTRAWATPEVMRKTASNSRLPFYSSPGLKLPFKVLCVGTHESWPLTLLAGSFARWPVWNYSSRSGFILDLWRVELWDRFVGHMTRSVVTSELLLKWCKRVHHGGLHLHQFQLLNFSDIQ